MSTLRIPPTYISHGGGPSFFMPGSGPMSELGPNSKTAEFLRGLPTKIGNTPRAIVVISAHWEESQCTVTSAARPTLLFDYHGFPADMYKLTYPCPGSPELATEVSNLLKGAGIACGHNVERGLDHGVFVPLKLIFPDASIPVVQVSLLTSLDPSAHIAIGQALAPLAESGVLLLGSGSATHNLRRMGSGQSSPDEQKLFIDWLASQLSSAQMSPDERLTRLVGWETGPSARLAHPREEHLIPLMVIAGAAAKNAGAGGGKAQLLNDEWPMGISQAAFLFE